MQSNSPELPLGRWRASTWLILAGALAVLASPLLGSHVAAVGIVAFSAAIAATAPRNYRSAVWVGWGLRTLVAVLGLTLVTLPDSKLDAVFFQTSAELLSQMPFTEWVRGPPTGVNPYPWALAGVYQWTGAHLFVGISINVLLGTVLIRGVALCANTLWSGRAGNLAAWAAALFPTFILYSAVLIRDISIMTLTVGLMWATLRIWGPTVKMPVVAIGVWILAVVSLPQLQLGFTLIVPAVVLMLAVIKLPFGQKPRGSVLIVLIAVAWILLQFFSMYAPDGLSISTGGVTGNHEDFEDVAQSQEARQGGRTSYPDELTVEGPMDALLLFFPRLLAFMFLPMPWNIRAFIDVIGVIDSLLYVVLTGLVLWSMKDIKRPKIAFIVMVASLILLIYSMGVSNMGTAVRHRAKAAVLLIALAVGPLANPSNRVTFWISGLGHGGAERQLLEVANRLHARGREILLVASRSGRRSAQVEAAGFPAHIPKSTKTRPWALLTCAWHAAGSATVVTFLYGPNLLGRLMRPFTGNRLVTCLRAIQFGGPPRHWFLRRTRRLDDAWTSNSKAALAAQEEDQLAMPGKGHVILNGVDVPGTPAPLPESPFTWICVGRLRPEKDHQTLLNAWALATKPDGATLRIVGDGPNLQSLTQLATSLGVQDSVQFAGAIMDMTPEYERAHALVLSSRTEGSPNCVLEAMAHGRAVLATEVGGTPEALGPGAGELVPAQDPAAMAAAITKFMQLPPQDLLAMGNAGNAHAQAHHDWERIVDQWEALLWP